jgi:hypothetical protein
MRNYSMQWALILKHSLTIGSKDEGMVDHSNVVAPIGIEIRRLWLIMMKRMT